MGPSPKVGQPDPQHSPTKGKPADGTKAGVHLQKTK